MTACGGRSMWWSVRSHRSEPPGSKQSRFAGPAGRPLRFKLSRCMLARGVPSALAGGPAGGGPAQQPAVSQCARSCCGRQTLSARWVTPGPDQCGLHIHSRILDTIFVSCTRTPPRHAQSVAGSARRAQWWGRTSTQYRAMLRERPIVTVKRCAGGNTLVCTPLPPRGVPLLPTVCTHPCQSVTATSARAAQSGASERRLSAAHRVSLHRVKVGGVCGIWGGGCGRPLLRGAP